MAKPNPTTKIFKMLTEPTILDKGFYKKLPQCYKKFYLEWKHRTPSPVHYIPKQGKYEKNPETGEVERVQNVPIPLLYCPQEDNGLWGGEAVVQGLRYIITGKKYWQDYGPIPKFWIPELQDGVVYSEVLNKHMKCIVTKRAIKLINENYGLDNYLLKSTSCDLRNLLALKLKRKILLALRDKTLYPGDETKREQIYDKYKHYLEQFTNEEIDWYGLTLEEARAKLSLMLYKKNKESIVPLKHVYRKQFLQHLEESRNKPTKTEEPWWKKKLISYK